MKEIVKMMSVLAILSLLILLPAGEGGKIFDVYDDSSKWTKTFGGSGTDFYLSVEQTTDGGYVLAGYTYSYGAGKSDVWLVKTDEYGNEEWNRTFGGGGYDSASSVEQTSDGGYIIAGYTGSYAAGEEDIWLIKTDSIGNEIWNRTFGNESGDQGYSGKQTPDGGYVLTGWLGGNICLIKASPTGEMEWNKTFEKVLEYGGAAYSLDLIDDDNDGVADDGYIITGSGYPYHGAGRSDVILLKTDEYGNLEWNQSFGGGYHDEGWAVQQTTDGGYAIAGNTGFSWRDPRNHSSDIWLIKTDSQGNMEWNKTFGGKKWDEGYSLQQTTDGGYIITGYTKSNGLGIFSDIWLIKTDSQGNMEWNREFGGWESEIAFSVEQTTDRGYIVAGGTYSYGAGGLDAWLIKTNSNGRSTGLKWVQLMSNHLYIFGREILPL